MSLIKRGAILRIQKTAASATELLIDRPLAEEQKIVEGKNPEFLYFVAKAIAAGDEGPLDKEGNRIPNPNGNLDYFPKKEIEAAYQTFIGKGIYLDHNASSVMYSVGKILDAFPTTDSENGEWSISCLAKIDRKLHPEIARKVETGELNTVSMGCSCAESKCNICGTVLHTDDDPKCAHLEPGRIGREYTAEIDLPEYGINKGSTIKSFAINSGINFNELSLVGVPAWPRAFVTTILSNLKSTISKKASLTKEEQLDLVAQFEKLIETLEPSIKEQVKAEFCGCPITKETNTMSDNSQKQSNDELTDILKKTSAYEMEKLENHILHKTRKAEATAAAENKTQDESWVTSIVEKVANKFFGKKEVTPTVVKTASLTASFTVNKEDPMKSTWALLDGEDKLILDATLTEIWGNQFKSNEEFAVSEEYGKAVVARFLDPKLGGVEKLADLWDVSYKLNKNAGHIDPKFDIKDGTKGELFKAKDFFVPGSDSSNDYKPEDIKHMSEKEHAEAPGKKVNAGKLDEKFDITEGKGKLFDAKNFFEPGSDSSNKWNDKRVKIEYNLTMPGQDAGQKGPAAPKGQDVKTEYSFKYPGQEAGQKGPAASKPAEVKIEYNIKKPEGEFVNTNKKTKIDEEHAKSEEKMKTGYKGDLMYDEEKKADHGKKESALKTAGEVSHKVEDGSNKNVLENAKTSGDTPETAAEGGSYVKSSKTVGDAPEGAVSEDQYPNKNPKTSGDEPASSYQKDASKKAAKTVGDAPEGAVKDSQYPKPAEPNKDPEAAVAENNMPKGTPDLTKAPDSAKAEKAPEPAKSDKDPETSTKDMEYKKHPDLTSKPDHASKEDQYPTPADPSKKPDSAYKESSKKEAAKMSEEAQKFISKEIEHLIKDKGYKQDRAQAAAYAQAREKGYDVPKKADLEDLPKPEHETENLSLEAPKPEVGSAFDKVENSLEVGDGYSAAKDKESNEIIISKDGKEMKRLPDGFGADVAAVTSLLKAVLGLPATEENKTEKVSPVEEVVEKVEVHPETSSPSETPALKASSLNEELSKKEAVLKAKEEELNKKAEEIKQWELNKQAERFQTAVTTRSQRCKKVIEAMLEKNVLGMNEEVLQDQLHQGAYLLDARKTALDHSINSKLKELMAMDDTSLSAVEKTVNDIKLPEAEVSKKATKVPFVQWKDVASEEEDIKAIFDQMGRRNHWNQ